MGAVGSGEAAVNANFGIVAEIKVHVISDSSEQEAIVDFKHGVNRVPTWAELDDYRKQAIEAVNKALRVDDCRLATIGDRGFAEPVSLRWPESEPAARSPVTDGEEGL